MTNLFFIFLFLSNLNDPNVASFALKANKIQKVFVKNTQNEEDRIMHRIFFLPEVREKNKFIDSISNHKHGISIIMRKKGTSQNDYYWFQVGYNSDIRFTPYFNFYVYKPGITIKYLDTSTNEILSLSEWRKREAAAKKH